MVKLISPNSSLHQCPTYIVCQLHIFFLCGPVHPILYSNTNNIAGKEGIVWTLVSRQCNQADNRTKCLARCAQ